MDENLNAVAIFNKFAETYELKYMDASMYSKSLDKFCSLISTENATVLDMACGPGNITKYISMNRPDFKVHGIDLAPEMIDRARKNNPSATFELFDCREINEFSSQFDGIMCGFALPYLSKKEALQLISNSANKLNPNSVIYISTMEGDYSSSQIQKGSSGDEIFMHFHQADYLTQALQESNLELVYTERIETDNNGTITTDLILIARRKD